MAASAAVADTTITVLHTNDLHAHVEPTVIRGKSYGGYARQATLIEQFRKSDPNTVLLNGGDTFQGTLYFNVYEGLADLAFMNAVRYEGMAVGNHEFDRGPGVFAQFASQASFPVLAANLDLSGEPDLDAHIAPFAVIEVNGHKVGLVGAVTAELPDISSPGPNVKMLDLEQSVQAAVNELTRQKVYRVILLSHCGYEEEKKLAAKIRGLDVIVGGHSHTLLCNEPFKFEGWPQPRGEYPTSVMSPTGSPCLVVQAWDWGKVLGRIKVVFNDMGRVKSYFDAKPIPITDDIKEDVRVKSILSALAKPIDQLKNKRVADAAVRLGRDELGEIIADAMVAATAKQGVVMAFMNPGGVRADIEPGEITYGEAISVQPFNNTVTVLDLKGREILMALSEMSSRHDGTGSPMHVSKGVSYRIDRSAQGMDRIKDFTFNGLPIGLDETYRIATNSFMANGGDGIASFRDTKGRRYDTGELDLDILIAYLQANSPVSYVSQKRARG